jgi:hypothetical protein
VATGSPHTGDINGPHVHVEQVASGATRPPLPSTTIVVIAGHEGTVAPWNICTGPDQPAGIASAQTAPVPQLVFASDGKPASGPGVAKQNVAVLPELVRHTPSLGQSAALRHGVTH